MERIPKFLMVKVQLSFDCMIMILEIIVFFLSGPSVANCYHGPSWATTFTLTWSEHIVQTHAGQKYKFFQSCGSKLRNKCTSKSTTTVAWIKGRRDTPCW